MLVEWAAAKSTPQHGGFRFASGVGFVEVVAHLTFPAPHRISDTPSRELYSVHSSSFDNHRALYFSRTSPFDDHRAPYSSMPRHLTTTEHYF
jgi:hypothetical protein